MTPTNEQALLEVVKAARRFLAHPHPSSAVKEQIELNEALANLDRMNP